MGMMDEARAGHSLYATFETSMGNLVVELLPAEAPKTVENFVGLASGEKEWTDPRTNKKSVAPLYDGTRFHRVIPEFMIQGGDPLGNGRGGPGYQFEDEFQSGRTFDRPGLLAMANAGPNTNGSQFFITEVPTPWLNGKHTIFGEVLSGQELVGKIARAGDGKVILTRVVITTGAPG
ncbi:MAG: peptidylprolyl isomerase [Deltaproteobacteria bacterium]|nr:peptidylprolyl isomerase [Deltaproteobacteria bacterium]MBI3075374.1 peptidylprolyl isomerase [Deltaproteobacteria bacterium]